MQRTLLLLVSALLLGSILGYAETLHVPEDYPTIQAAIDGAQPDDRVVVAPGTYRESVTIDKSVRLEGADRTAVRIEAPDSKWPVLTVVVDSGEVVLKAVGLSGGKRGVQIMAGEDAAVRMIDLAVVGNEVGLAATGDGSVSVDRCCFAESVIGIVLAGPRAEVVNSEIVGGTFGVVLDGSRDVTMSRCLVGMVQVGVAAHSRGCGCEACPETYPGTVSGGENRILGISMDLCPASSQPPWPDAFTDEVWRVAIGGIVNLYEEGVRAYEEQEYSEARNAYEQALVGFESEEVSFPFLHAGISRNLGSVYVKLGRYEEALAKYEAARAVYVDYEMEVDVAELDSNIGVVFRDLARYEKALAAYGAARAVFVSHDLWISVAKVDSNMAALRAELGRYEEALTTFLAARAVYVENGMQVDVAKVDESIAAVYRRLGHFEDALDRYQSARAVYVGHDMEVSVAGIDVGIGNICVVLGDYEQALAAYRSARAALTKHELEVDAALVDSNIGVVYRHLGDYEQALDACQSALQLLNRTPPAEGIEVSQPSIRWTILFNVGMAHESLEEWDQAVSAYRASVGVVESIRGVLTFEELKLAWQERTKHVYERLVNLLIRTGNTKAALGFVERCRARTFLDLVATGPIGALESIAEEGICTGVVEASAIEADLDEVVDGIPEGAAALEYFVTDKATYVWVVRDGSVSEPIRIEIDRTTLQERVFAFRTTIEMPTTGLMDLPDDTVLTMSRDLYELLIAPAEEQLEDIEHLVIVPSGPLYYLPFCALIDCPGCEGPAYLDGEYLIERHSLSYAPSLTTLKYAWASGDEVQTDPLFLALADPDAGDPVFRRLPEAQREARVVAGLFDPNEVYVDGEATEEVVADRAGEADQILLATHGSFNPVNPMFSYLLLSPTDESDGRLYTHEIFGLDLHTDLVTLSACETLLPALEDAEEQVLVVLQGEDEEEEDVELTQELLETLTAGDEIVGLTRALLYAGTPSVLSTLWRVVSETTEPLMVAFYGYLKDGLDKAEALRQAQLDVMASYPHPRYWAAFELVGDWRTRW